MTEFAEKAKTIGAPRHWGQKSRCAGRKPESRISRHKSASFRQYVVPAALTQPSGARGVPVGRSGARVIWGVSTRFFGRADDLPTGRWRRTGGQPREVSDADGPTQSARLTGRISGQCAGGGSPGVKPDAV